MCTQQLLAKYFVWFVWLQLKRYKTYCQLLQSKLVFHSSPSQSRSREMNEEMVSSTSPKYNSSLSATILATSPKKPRRPDKSSDYVFKVQRMRSGRLSCSVEEPESWDCEICFQLSCRKLDMFVLLPVLLWTIICHRARQHYKQHTCLDIRDLDKLLLVSGDDLRSTMAYMSTPGFL